MKNGLIDDFQVVGCLLYALYPILYISLLYSNNVNKF